MEPVTLALLLLAGLGTVSLLTWTAVRSWLTRKRAVQADLIRTALEDGSVNVVVIGLRDDGAEAARRTWHTKQLDPDLAATFGYRDQVRVTV
ncbi:hypothetical protein [Streptacidiphilus sp. EB129]|uniref:hypothetical protein n=1 Tax=Streptacidiphilus sp. EB129 TaxID=3156262 RepID=UPI003518334A